MDEEAGEKKMQMKEVQKSSRRITINEIVNGTLVLPQVQEFKNLATFDDSISNRWTRSQGQRYNKTPGFNVDPNILPFDHNRITLRNRINGCDYINCSWISQDSDESNYDEVIYTEYLPFFKIKFAVGQSPLPSTMLHHYSMVHEQKFDFVISFTGTETKRPLKVGKTYHINDVTLKVHTRTELQECMFRY